MNIALTLSALLFLGFTKNFVRSAIWMDELTSYIVKESGARQTAIITQLPEGQILRNLIVDELMTKLIKFPTLRINFSEDLDQPEFLTGSKVFEAANPICTSSTFFLLVHESRKNSAHKFIDAVAEIASLQYQPKYLMIFVGPKLRDSPEELLEHSWSKKLLDFTVLELAQPSSSEDPKAAGYPLDPPIVHRLNPFKNEHTRKLWSGSSDELFPKKANNLFGHLLRVRAVNIPPFTRSKFNDIGEPLKVGGPFIELIKSVARKLNASVKFLPDKRLDVKTSVSDTVDFIYHAGEAQNMDLNSLASSRTAESRYSSLHSAPVMMDGLCAVVPILRETEVPVSGDMLKAFLLSFGVVTVFWIVRRVLRFRAGVWPLFNIACILFGVSVSPRPDRNAERVMFTCLIAVSVLYASNIYAAITDISLQVEREMKFESVEDLDASGLKPFVDPFSFKMMFYAAEGALASLKSKAIITTMNMMECARTAASDKNITCIMEEGRAEIAVELSKIGGVPAIKIAKPCFGYENKAFQLSRRLPYRSSIDSILSRMQSGGLVGRFIEEEKKASLKHDDGVDGEVANGQLSMVALRKQLLAIVFVGWTVSVLAFVAELVVYAVWKRRESRILRVGRFRYVE